MALLARLRVPGAGPVLLFGYVGQAYAAVVSLAFSPFILDRIGAEAYGLVGIFLIVQAWFQLLDAGLTPALSRESARFRGGAVTAGSLRDTARGLEWVVGGSALPILALTWLVADEAAARWVQRETLELGEISLVLQLTMVILIIRWLGGVRRGLLTGFERHLTLYSINFTVATLRFPAIVAYFALVTPTATSYFLWQLGVSVLEAALLWAFSRRLAPAGPTAGPVQSVRSLRSIAAFAANHGLVAVLWILIAQTDKLVLSRLLSLSDFGYFSLAAAAAAGVNLIVLPINQMLMPRLARLAAEHDEPGLIALYRRATRGTVVLVGSVAVLFGGFGHAVMLAWTGDPAIAERTGGVLAWYAIGNTALAFSLFAYYLQYAHGRLRLHVIGTVGFLVTVVPALIWAGSNHGMLGTAMTWAALWLVYLVTWVSVTHRRFMPGQAAAWLFGDVARPLAAAAATGLALRALVPLPDERLPLGLTLIGYGALFLAAGLLGSGLLGSLPRRARRAV